MTASDRTSRAAIGEALDEFDKLDIRDHAPRYEAIYEDLTRILQGETGREQ
ncbi:hypothetical protein [Rarobacter incanus]|uniref:Uncharacterized protein n=1 Tax=Rarobacter incanus TaxID=153494 RepID=A0A542SLP8_9MICO|nr:hypothetical protein [Rarobacter incanus]TQK75542.1 hypothetical protein FB389_0172 [Rarobacter incanus]